MKNLILAVMVSLAFTACKKVSKEPVAVQEDSMEVEVAKEWVSLFDGESLNGWHLYNKPEVDNPWKVEEGLLVFPGREKGSKPEFNLVTDKEYTDFVLSLEWKISEGGNSGIMWAVIEDLKYEHPYDTGPEIQVLDNERHPDALANPKFHQAGALYDMVQPMYDVCKPAGEWNLCEIEINYQTNHGHVTLNGTEIVSFPLHGAAWDDMVANSKFKDWEGFGKSKTGRICLQDHNDMVSFKNIKIREL